jgi:protein TonB
VMTKQEERKKRTVAALTTIGVNTLILLVMIFAGGWSRPGAPAAEYGIEVNLGYDNQGSGDVQPTEPTGTDQPNENQDEPSPQTEVQPQEEVIPNTEAPKEIVDTKASEEITTSDNESPVEIKKEEKKVVKPVEKPVEKIKEKVTEPKVEEKPKVVDTKAVYKPKTPADPTVTGNGDGREGKPGNEGDDAGKPGDKGNPQGTVDAKGYYGKPGGGDGGEGPSIVLNGWEWDNIVKPNIEDSETGRIVFDIEVDENGDLIGVRKESGSVSAAAERACLASLEKLTFTRKAGAKVPAVTKGKITFVIRAR